MVRQTPAAPLSFRLDGKTALVTGAGRGIGAAIASAFAAAGALVGVNDLDGASAAASADAIVAAGGRALALPGDVGTPDAVARIFDALAAQGGIDILVNNAGTTRDETIFDITLESWNELLRINLTSAFLCSKRAMTMMRDQGRGGRIIVMGSVTGHQGALYGHLHYATTKAGLHGFAKTLARTGAPLGITVNAIAPGIVVTDLLRRTHGDEGIAVLEKLVPAGLGAPADIGAAALYLASEAGRQVTGAVLDVNGGMLMR